MMTWLVAMDEGEKNKLSAPLIELWDKAMAGKLPSTAEQVDWDRVFKRVLNAGEQGSCDDRRFKAAHESAGERVAVAVVILGMIISGSILLLNRKTPKEIVKTGKTSTTSAGRDSFERKSGNTNALQMDQL